MQICLIQLLIGAGAKLFMQAGLQEVCARNDAHSMKVLNVYLLVCWSVKGPVGGRATCNISLAVTQTCSSSFHDRRMGKKIRRRAAQTYFRYKARQPEERNDHQLTVGARIARTQLRSFLRAPL